MLRSARNARDPTILLWDIRLEDMEALLNFMYHGEVNITQEKLNHFLDLAERLQVRGLTSSGGEKEKKEQQQQQQQQSRSNVNNIKKMMPALPTTPIPQAAVMAAVAKRPKMDVSADLAAASSSSKNDDALSTTSSTFTPPVITEIHTGESFGDFDSSFMDESGENNGGSGAEEEDRGGLPMLPQFAMETSMNVGQMEPVVGMDGSKGTGCLDTFKRFTLAFHF